MSKLSKSILDQIKKENVKPKSRWYFMALHGAIWTAVIVTIALGSMGIAVAYRHLSLTDWELANQISSNPLNFVPVLWIAIIALAIFAADQIFKRTRKGHRFKLSSVLVASLLLSLTLGSGFFLVEADQSFENTIRENVKPYQEWEEKRAAKFVAPHRGVLAGEITHIDLGEEWRVQDFKSKELWAVDVTTAEITENVDQSIGTKVAIKGRHDEEGRFEATHVRNFDDAKTHFERKRRALRKINDTLTEEQRTEVKERIQNGESLEEVKREIRDDLSEEQKREFRRLRDKMEGERDQYERRR